MGCGCGGNRSRQAQIELARQKVAAVKKTSALAPKIPPVRPVKLTVHVAPDKRIDASQEAVPELKEPKQEEIKIEKPMKIKPLNVKVEDGLNPEQLLAKRREAVHILKIGLNQRQY